MTPSRSFAGALAAVLVVGAAATAPRPAVAATPATPPAPPALEAARAPAKPYLRTTRAGRVAAVVTAIDYDTRVVTLTGEGGRSFTFTASEDVKNLRAVAPGDRVTADYEESLTIEVVSGIDAAPGRAEMSATARSAEGQLPGVLAVTETVVTADVVGIDIPAGTFTLQGPEGPPRTYRAANPANLEAAEVGDTVIIRVSAAAMIAVDEAM